MHSSAMKVAKKEIKKSIVDHTYRDYSQVDISDLADDFSYKGLNEELFPAKLHKMLSTAECAHIIAWKPHGRAWAVVNKSLFISIVLPKYFNHSNFESFNRSVNGWGFKVSMFPSSRMAFFPCYSFINIVTPTKWLGISLLIFHIACVCCNQRLLQEGPDENSYYHELFLQGKLELTSIMARLINPGKRLPK